jgi:uncharacterized phage protein (TIGR02216 family)
MEDERFAAAAARLAGFSGVLLGWRPGDFWAATPAEMRAALGALMPEETEPAGRAELERLMGMFPDG